MQVVMPERPAEGGLMATKKEEAPKVEEAPKATATTAAPVAKKKTPVGLIIAIVVIVLVVLSALGIGAFTLFVGKKVNDAFNDGEASVNLGGEDVSLNVNEGQKWPDTMPSSVPKFTKGTIVSSGKFGEAWTVAFSGVTKADVTAYRATMAAAGWEMTDSIEYEGALSYTGTKNNYSVMLTYTSDDGEDSFLLTVTANQE